MLAQNLSPCCTAWDPVLTAQRSTWRPVPLLAFRVMDVWLISAGAWLYSPLVEVEGCPFLLPACLVFGFRRTCLSSLSTGALGTEHRHLDLWGAESEPSTAFVTEGPGCHSAEVPAPGNCQYLHFKHLAFTKSHASTDPWYYMSWKKVRKIDLIQWN